jgi:alkanesulfonate monooxygenase SsuD/methylene tetrahydromethanopterin reductase-like flavin-dependent oxidoreductase (luciferase family)
MRFGVYLPTFAWRDLSFDEAARVKEFARKAEALGFESLWVAEHFLEAPGLYGTVDATDHEEALSLQRPVFERVMGTHRSFENLQQSYFLGTTLEIIERIRDLEASGIQEMILATCNYDLEQLERFASEIVGRFGRAR